MSTAVFGTVNATGLNVSGILQAGQVITAQPMQVSNLLATGSLGVTGLSTLGNVTASGSVNFLKNVETTGLITQKNDFAYVDPVCPIPSMILGITAISAYGASAFFERSTLTIHQSLYITKDVEKKESILIAGINNTQNFGLSPKFTSFELMDVCTSQGAHIRSVSAGYDMKNLATGEFVRWKMFIDPTFLNNAGYDTLGVVYGYWHMCKTYIDTIYVSLDGVTEVVQDQVIYEFDGNMDSAPFSFSITTDSNSISNFSMSSSSNDITDPVLAFKCAASYMLATYIGLNDGLSVSLNLTNQKVLHADKASFLELYNAMLQGDIWDTKYTNQKVKEYGPKYDTVGTDPSKYFNQYNCGFIYSDANWNSRFSNILAMNAFQKSDVDYVYHSYFQGPQSTTDLYNQMKIAIPVECYGNIEASFAFVAANPQIIPSRPVMHVRAGMSYYELCECLIFLFNRFFDGHVIFRMWGRKNVSRIVSKSGIVLNAPPDQPLMPPFIGSAFINSDGKYNIPYTFAQLKDYIANGPDSQDKVANYITGAKMNIEGFVPTNTKKVNSSYSTFGASSMLVANDANITGPKNVQQSRGCSVPLCPTAAFVSNVYICAHYYTDPTMYTAYAHNIVKTAITSTQYTKIYNPALTAGYYTPASLWAARSSNLAFKNTLSYMTTASYVNVSGLTVNGNAVPFSSNLASVQLNYRSNTVAATDLFTGIDWKVLPIQGPTDPVNFGPVTYKFSYYFRHSNGDGWSESAWVAGMTSNLATYQATLADTYFVKARNMYPDDIFGLIDNNYANTYANLAITGNVGYIATIAEGAPAGFWDANATGLPGRYRTSGTILTAASSNTICAFALGYSWYDLWYDTRGSHTAPLYTYRIYRFMKDVLGVNETFISDLRGNIGGYTEWASFYNQLLSRSTAGDTLVQNKIGFLSPESARVDGTPKTGYTSMLTLANRTQFQYNTGNVHNSDTNYYFQGPSYPTPTKFTIDDQIKLLVILDERTNSAGEYICNYNGMIGTRGNVHSVRMGYITAGSIGAAIESTVTPIAIFPPQYEQINTVLVSADGTYNYAKGVLGVESVAFGGIDNLTQGVNTTYIGTYANVYLDAGLRTAWQDAGYTSNTGNTFFINGPKYTYVSGVSNVASIKTQGWRDMDLERALLYNKNTTYNNFSNITYVTANKNTLLTYPPY